MNLKTSWIAMAMACTVGLGHAEDQPFEQDRRAILAMAGEFNVGFHFRETLSLKPDYTVNAAPYEEQAKEIVKVVEDSGRKIVLQHLLQVGPAVVKHWAQIWTYEDTEILEFDGSRVWHTRVFPAEQVRGTWSQRVTQVDDSPRYEGFAKWQHHGGISEWTATANRPLPRREQTKRKDYDLLVVTNRHTITHEGWFHEQDNTKWIKRAGQNRPLCREIGYNPYRRIVGHDFSKANAYWEKTAPLWKDIRQVWDELTPRQGGIKVRSKAEPGRLQDVVQEFVERAEAGSTPGIEEIRTTLKAFVTPVANPT